MNDVLVMNKQVGETPLECINRFKEAHPEYRDIKMTYAGRLDPMAEGVLVVLAGEMVYKKDEFLKLLKVYECVAILGIETDTYDVLGLPTGSLSTLVERVDREAGRVRTLLESFIGTFSQSYPPYSSKTINGKQMHTLAREGGLENLEIPKQAVTVKSISNIRMASMSTEDLVKDVTENIGKVKGDFRQEESIKKWNEVLNENTPPPYGHLPLAGEDRVPLVLFTIEVSGGTYIRGIVHALGQQLGIGACILRLKRTHVGTAELCHRG